MNRAGVSLTLWMAAALASALAGPVDLSAPAPSLGAASSEGYVLLVREVDEADFGKGVALPVRLQFKSKPGVTSPLLGGGWSLPLLECTTAPFSENLVRADLPCGKRLWLWEKKRGSGETQTLDGQWKGRQQGDSFVVSREDGWELRYDSRGRLSSLRTDGGRVLEWQYFGRGGILLREGANTVVTAEVDAQGRLVKLLVNGREHQTEFGERPRVVEIKGQRMVEALDATLAKWKLPGGREESFVQEVTPEVFPKLAVKDREGVETDYTWLAGSGFIRTEGDWTYQIEPKGKELPKLSRTNTEKKTESIEEDRVKGVVTIQDLDGTIRKTTFFTSPGAVFEKVRKIEETKGAVTKIVNQFTYDEAGRRIREINARGVVTTYAFNEQGELLRKNVEISKDPAIQKELTSRERALKMAVQDAEGDDVEKSFQLLRLSYFYIHDLKSPEKALALVDSMPSQIDQDAVRISAIKFNDRLNDVEKLKGYQDLKNLFPEAGNDHFPAIH